MEIKEIRGQKGSKINIIQHLRIHGSMSRIDLTRQTGLSRATISLSIAELMECNLVKETDNRQTTKGRPATSLELVPHSATILGADFDNKTWTLGAFDLIGNVIQKKTIPINDFDPVATFHVLANAIEQFVSTLEKPPIPLLGLGVPGLLDADHSKIRSAADLNWHNIDVADIMKTATGWPTIVVNRHRARGLAECRYGSGQGYNNMVYIGVGSGIASGLYLNRQLLSGSLGGAGEIGHNTVEPDGPLCPCGNQGCLQVLSAGPAIEQHFRRHVRSGKHSTYFSGSNLDLQLVKAPDICEAAENGDELAAEVVRKSATYLGITMANLLNTFNPEAIILGGTLPSISPLYVQTATNTMRSRGMSPLSANTCVRTSTLKDTGGALGAANFAFDKNISSLFSSLI